MFDITASSVKVWGNETNGIHGVGSHILRKNMYFDLNNWNIRFISTKYVYGVYSSIGRVTLLIAFNE